MFIVCGFPGKYSYFGRKQTLLAGGDVCFTNAWKWFGSCLPKNKVHNNLTKPLWATEIQSQLAAHHGEVVTLLFAETQEQQNPGRRQADLEDVLPWNHRGLTRSCLGVAFESL